MDNRKQNKEEIDNTLKEILNDDTPIAEDVDPADHGDAVDEEDIDTNTVENEEDGVEDKAEVEEDSTDYKQKFSASSREATTLHFKNKQLTDTIDKASHLPEPGLEELKDYAKAQGSEYDDLDEFAQNILKRTLINEKRFEMIHSTSTENKSLDDWADKVDSFSNSPETLSKYPVLSDLDIDFKKYCMKESRRGMEMEDLLASFLFGVQGDNPMKKRVRSNKEMLLAGGGSQGEPAKPKQLTAEELRVIRTKNPSRYKILVKEGKAGIDLLDRE